mgnify:CR=1 FL=1
MISNHQIYNSNIENHIFYYKKFIIEIKKTFILISFHKQIYLELEDTQNMYDMLYQIHLKTNKKLTLLLDVNGVIGTNKASRDLGTSALAIKITQKLVLVTDSMISKLMANFFMKVTPPPYPIRIVNSINEGIKWLQKH